MLNRIHIFGASGSGTTTLGTEIQREFGHKHLDTDDYFWETKYTKIREASERIYLITNEISKYDKWVLTGSLCGWGDIFIKDFNLVVYLYIPKNERMKRLQNREFDRYGQLIVPGKEKYEDHITFMNWAAQYDDGDETVRSKELHSKWINKLECSVLKIEGMNTVLNEMELVRTYLERKES